MRIDGVQHVEAMAGGGCIAPEQQGRFGIPGGQLPAEGFGLEQAGEGETAHAEEVGILFPGSGRDVEAGLAEGVGHQERGLTKIAQNGLDGHAGAFLLPLTNLYLADLDGHAGAFLLPLTNLYLADFLVLEGRGDGAQMLRSGPHSAAGKVQQAAAGGFS